MVIGTFNGADIIAVPTSPGIRTIALDMNDAVGESTSVFTKQSQEQYWPGGDLWTGTITLPSITADDIGKWRAFFAQLRGKKNVFRISDPLRPSPHGIARGVPKLDGDHAAMASQIATKGWTPNTALQLVEGDYFQIGERLHIVLETVRSDAEGKAVIKCWPNLRETADSDAALILHKPTGLFRLAENKRTITTVESRLSSLTLKIVEAK